MKFEVHEGQINIDGSCKTMINATLGFKKMQKRCNFQGFYDDFWSFYDGSL